MTPTVYHLHSTIELPLTDLYDVVDELELPPEIETVTTDERETILVLESTPTTNDIGAYTPTASLKATLSEKRIPIETDSDPEPDHNGLWSKQQTDPTDPDATAEPEMETVRYAGFKGYGENVLFNKALQYPMFQVLCEIARHAESGTLTAIVGTDEELSATKIVDGEERSASVTVTEEDATTDSSSTDWRNNEFITSS